MATFDNLVAEVAGGPMIDRFIDVSQEGTSWEFYLPIVECLDDDGEYTEVDWTDVTCVWQILTKSQGGTVVATLTTSLTDDNQWKGIVSPSDTANLAENYSNPARTLPWICTLTNAAARKVSAFGPHDSRIIIKQG
jgi:hypothetical protein